MGQTIEGDAAPPLPVGFLTDGHALAWESHPGTIVAQTIRRPSRELQATCRKACRRSVGALEKSSKSSSLGGLLPVV